MLGKQPEVLVRTVVIPLAHSLRQQSYLAQPRGWRTDRGMLIGSIRIRPNHPLVVVGSTGLVDDPVDLEDAESKTFGQPTAHVLVPVRGQVAPTEVKFWRSAAPAVGEVRFDGVLDLPDGRIAVFDVENVTRLVISLGRAGSCPVTILSDRDRQASRIDIVIDRGEGKLPLANVAGHSLPHVYGLSEDLATPTTRLGLILDEHNFAVSRLVNALAILAGNDLSGSPHADAKHALRVRWVAEWLRELRPGLSFERCRELETFIDRRLAPSSLTDETDPVQVAMELWELLQHL